MIDQAFERNINDIRGAFQFAVNNMAIYADGVGFRGMSDDLAKHGGGHFVFHHTNERMPQRINRTGQISVGGGFYPCVSEGRLR